MTSSLVESQRVFSGRLLGAIALVFTLQAALVYWLGDNHTTVITRTSPKLQIGLGDPRPEELVALEDPTLFVLPHIEGFSGEAWMRIPKQEFLPEDWSEPPRWLALQEQNLATGFTRFMETNSWPRFQNLITLQPELTYPDIPPASPVTAPSTLRIEGDLAGRQLLAHPDIPSYSSSDLLRNTVVQLMIDSQGRTFSAVILPPGSGSVEADNFALEFARTARFNSIEHEGPGTRPDAFQVWTIGRMIFNWQTLPPTNGGLAIP